MEKFNLLEKEVIEPKAEIISFETLLDEIYKGSNLPSDNRFLPIEKGGVFKYFEVRNLTEGDYKKRGDRIFPVVRINNEIVALSELEKNPNNPNNFWIKFVCVDHKYENNGYATKLIEEIFKFAKENNYSLTTSIYSDEGLEKLKKIIHRLQFETGVSVSDRNKINIMNN